MQTKTDFIQQQIELYIDQIRKMAKRALGNMEEHSAVTFDDMVNEGIYVLIHDALPHHVPKGQPGYRASFKSYLTVCLRNHYVDMMKKSYRKSGNPFAERQYTIERNAKTEVVSPEDAAAVNMLIEEFSANLSSIETKYVLLLLDGNTRKGARQKLGLSAHSERKLYKSIVERIMGDTK